MKELLTLISLLSPRNLIHFFLLLKKEPKRYILANLNQKVQSLRSPFRYSNSNGDTKYLRLIANGFVRDQFYKVKGSLEHQVEELTIVDSSGQLNHKVELKKTKNAYSFNGLIKIDNSTKKNRLFLKIRDGKYIKKIKLTKFNLSAKRNCNKSEVYLMKVDEEQKLLSSNTNFKSDNEDILFSFIVENNNSKWDLENTIASLETQYYKNWELLVPLSVANESWSQKFDQQKIKFIKIDQAYSTSTRNLLLSKCSGSFIGIIEDEDILHPHYLSQIHYEVKNNPNLQFAYVDADVIDNEVRRFPKYKPALSIDHLRCTNYIGSFYMFSKKILNTAHGFNEDLNLKSSHHDFILRVIDQNTISNSIVHIDHILHHKSPLNESNKYDESLINDDKIAISDHLKRNTLNAQVKQSKIPGIYTIEYTIEDTPLISILIPFKNEYSVLKTCIESILTKTTYPNYEIILIDHESSETSVIEYYKSLINQYDHIKCLNYKGEFNYSAINNWAVQFTAGSHLVFLNNDTEVLSEGWLNRMYQYGMQKDIGVVGALLLYPDHTIQHDGVYFGFLDQELKYPTSQYINKMQNIGEDNAYHPYVVKNVKAVTAACMMVSKKDFLSVGGFDEVRFKVTCNDTDLCLRIGKEKRIVSLPDVILTHYESKSRGLNDTFKKIRLAQRELKLFYALHHEQFEKKEIIFNI